MDNEFIKSLENCDLVESRNALESIAKGATVSSPSDGTTCDNSGLQTYMIRLKHLQSLSSAHARRLAAATSEFVVRLKLTGSEGGSWYVIKGEGEYYFNIFRLQSGEIIGCLPVIAKTEVSDERWAEIWEKPKA